MYGFIAKHKNADFLTIDISTPSFAHIAKRLTLGNLCDLALVGNYIYAATSGGLRILDVTDPLNPVLLPYSSTDTWLYRIEIEAGYAYVSTGNIEGIFVYNLTNPLQPKKLGKIKMQNITDYCLVDKTLFMIHGEGTNLIDIWHIRSP